MVESPDWFDTIFFIKRSHRPNVWEEPEPEIKP